MSYHKETFERIHICKEKYYIQNNIARKAHKVKDVKNSAMQKFLRWTDHSAKITKICMQRYHT